MFFSVYIPVPLLPRWRHMPGCGKRLNYQLTASVTSIVGARGSGCRVGASWDVFSRVFLHHPDSEIEICISANSAAIYFAPISCSANSKKQTCHVRQLPRRGGRRTRNPVRPVRRKWRPRGPSAVRRSKIPVGRQPKSSQN